MIIEGLHTAAFEKPLTYKYSCVCSSSAPLIKYIDTEEERIQVVNGEPPTAVDNNHKNKLVENEIKIAFSLFELYYLLSGFYHIFPINFINNFPPHKQKMPRADSGYCYGHNIHVLVLLRVA